MKDFRILFDGIDGVSLPDGICLGVVGESNVVKLVLTLPESMVDGMDYHVVTIGGVDSARIVGTDVNIENAYRVGNVIYMPLSSAYTTQRITDLTVTAYKQTGDVVQIIDKTPTVYGLKFDEGQPRPSDGGLASEVAALENRVDGMEDEIDAIRDDVPTAEEIVAWNEAAANSHTHENKGVLDKLTESEFPAGTGTLKYNGVPVGIPVASTLPGSTLGYTFAYETTHNTLYRMDDPSPIPVASAETVEAVPDLVAKKHTHDNKAVLDGITSAKITGYDDAVSKKHEHSNKAVLDAVTDDVVTNTHTHANKTTIDKFSESGGKLLFDGAVVGNDVAVEDTLSDLEDGVIGVAMFDDASHLVYPRQDDAETVYVNVAGKRLKIGVPAFREDAIDYAIAAAALPSFNLECNNEAGIQGDIIPVVADINDNEYVDAGMELSADSTIIATATKKYAIQLQLTVNGFQAIRPEKIIEVDATHVSVPAMAFYMFEGLTGTFVGAGQFTVTEGWNVIYLTLDTTSYDVTGVDVITNADVNDYVFFVPSENNQMSIRSTSGSKLFENTIDCDCDENSKGIYVKQSVWQNINDVQDVVPLSFTTYSDLVIRDTVSDDSIQDVPVFVYNLVTSADDFIRLFDGDGNYITLGETQQQLDGMPIRYIKAAFNSSIKLWLPVPQYASDGTVYRPAGWTDENRTSTIAPSFVNFTPVKVQYNGTDYYGDLPYEVKTALNSLSQCINVSKDAMGHINLPDDAVVRFNGKIEPNRKYFFSTGLDCAFALPTVDFSKYDEQFVMYLLCAYNIDLSFPADTLFANIPNSDAGYHKIIGSFSRGFGKWEIGGIDYEVQT